jgi:hypothetical protein
LRIGTAAQTTSPDATRTARESDSHTSNVRTSVTTKISGNRGSGSITISDSDLSFTIANICKKI